jgi:diguanylate cyclase (GGDEF)-like protein
MEMLDLTTLRLSITFVSVICAFSLTIVWSINRALPGVQQWLIGFILNSFTFLIGAAGSFGMVSTPAMVFLNNSFSLISLSLLLEGSLRFRGFQSERRWKLIVGLAPLFMFLAWINVDNVVLRHRVHDTLAVMLLCATALVMVWKTRDRDEFKIFGLSAMFSLLLAAAFFSRWLIAWNTTPDPDLTVLPVSTMLYLGILLYLIGWTYTVTAACYFREHQQAVQLAREDALTRLPNRRSIDEILSRTLMQAQRHGQPFALVMMDIDRFKDVNDTLGHTVGDWLLAEVGQRLELFTRGADFVGRLGGDEFLLILNDISELEAGSSALERLRSSINGDVTLRGHAITIEVSLGLAIWPIDGETADRLLGTADRRMYREKELSRMKDAESVQMSMPLFGTETYNV